MLRPNLSGATQLCDSAQSMEAAVADERQQERRLQEQLGSCSRAAWQLELVLRELTAAIALSWELPAPPIEPSLEPPPPIPSLELRAGCVRQQLRALCVIHACAAPFDAWWRLCSERRREALDEVRASAAAAVRGGKLRAEKLAEQTTRLRQLEGTLRALGRRLAFQLLPRY